MEMQEKKGREIYQLIVDGKISILLARSLLKIMSLPDDAMPLIIDSTIIRHPYDTSTMDMCDLNRFYSLIDCSNLNRIGFQDYATCQRKKLTYEKLSVSLMHNLFLGKTNALALFKCF